MNELFPYAPFPEFEKEMDRAILKKILEVMDEKDKMNYRDRGDWSGTFESNLDNGRWVKYDYVEALLKEKDKQIEELSAKLRAWEKIADRMYYYTLTYPNKDKEDRDNIVARFKKLKEE